MEGRDLQVLALLGRHTDNRGWCCRSQVKMAKELGCGRATVQRSITRLVSAGYLQQRAKVRDSGADAAHEYRVVLDRPDLDEAVETDADAAAATEGTHERAGVPTGGQRCPRRDG
ncbi:MAG: helix-turn-helix domain-containing protein, partial [Mesorhizobium sp.]